MSLRFLVVLLLFVGPTQAFAEASNVTVSTNDAPLGRMVLQQVSEEAFRRTGIDFKLVSLPSQRSLIAANDSVLGGEGLPVGGLSYRILGRGLVAGFLALHGVTWSGGAELHAPMQVAVSHQPVTIAP